MASKNDTFLITHDLGLGLYSYYDNFSVIYNETNDGQNTAFRPADQSSDTSLFPIRMIEMALIALGIAGNSSFLFVVTRIKTMRTLPNLYFVNLALADFGSLVAYLVIVLVDLTSATSPDYNQQRASALLVLAAFVIPFLLFTCLSVSLISVCMISLERYLAICHPYKAIQLRQKFRVIVLLFLSWLLGSIPGIMHGVCFAPAVVNNEAVGKHLNLVPVGLLALLAVVSLFGVVLFYTLIAKEMTKLRRTRALPDAFVKEEKRVVTLCMVIAALFFLLVAPKALFLIYNSIVIYCQLTSPSGGYWMNNCTWYLIIVHFCLNPILYSAGSQNHRRAFQMAFSRQSARSRRASTTRTTGLNGTDNKHHNAVNANVNIQVEENLM